MVEQHPQHAADDRLALAVIGRQQTRGVAGHGLLDLVVETHQRHHQRRGGVAAEEPVALHEDHLGARVGGTEGRADAGRAAADHQHLRRPRVQSLARRKLHRAGNAGRHQVGHVSLPRRTGGRLPQPTVEAVTGMPRRTTSCAAALSR